ncbi:MAG: hypothetical protein JWO05_2511 [Gemmatimonadetes bacterium]|nr:hypothetical protein [Gemmatimonadota bacterium]
MMPRLTTLMCALSLLVPGATPNAPARAAGAPKQFRILLLRPKLVRNVNAAAADAIYAQVEQQVRELFPCANVRTVDDVVMMANNDREKALISGSAEDMTERIAELVGAEIVISLEFGSTGTTHESPGRYASATMYNVATGKVPMRNRMDADGWNWSAHDFVEGILAPLRAMEYDICPWVGTLDYSRTANVHKNVVEPNGDPTGQQISKLDQHEQDTWKFVISHGKPGEPPYIDTEGSSELTSKGIEESRWGSKGCFPQDKNGVVSDSGYVSNVSDDIIDATESTASAKGILRRVKLRITREPDPNIKVFSLSVEAMSRGSAETKAVSSRAGGCGSWKKEGPGGTGIPWGRLIVFTAEHLTVQKGRIDVTVTLTSAEGLSEDVTIKLTRN